MNEEVISDAGIISDEEFLEQVMKQKGKPVPKRPKVLEASIREKEEINSMIHTNMELFDSKKITNIKDNIEMTVVDGKLGALNRVTFDLVDKDVEPSGSSFFASVDSKEDTTKCELLIMRENDLIFQSVDTKHFNADGGKINLEIYPEEMIDIISKSINSNYDISRKFGKDGVHRFTQDTNTLELEEFKASIDLTSKAYDELMGEIKKLKDTNGTVNLDEFLTRYFFKKHLLIQGEKGGGKTYAVDKKIVDEGMDSELIIGHEGIEAIDLLGYYVKTETGDLVWLDGALTKAFRKAVDGKVVLFIDEMLRIPSRELNILVGSLTPSSTETYRLRTNRVINIKEGIGETELIEIPMHNLWSIGTTNVGAGYAVDDIDDALADRFRVVNKLTSNAELESILSNNASKNGISESVVPKLVAFYTQMRDLVVSGELEKYVNTRHLSEVIQLASDDSEIKMYMMDLIPTWTSTDTNGQPNKAEKDIITKMIKKIMK